MSRREAVRACLSYGYMVDDPESDRYISALAPGRYVVNFPPYREEDEKVFADLEAALDEFLKEREP
jgi:hypothetical protein